MGRAPSAQGSSVYPRLRLTVMMAIRYIRSGFSILEAIFAVAFLIIVGVGMQILANTVLRLTDASEVKTALKGLNLESLAYMTSRVKQADNSGKRDALFAEFGGVSNNEHLAPPNCGKMPDLAWCFSFYVNCPITPLDAACVMSKNRAPVTLPNSRHVVTRRVKVTWPRDVNGNLTIHLDATAIAGLGAGVGNEETASQRILFE